MQQTAFVGTENGDSEPGNHTHGKIIIPTQSIEIVRMNNSYGNRSRDKIVGISYGNRTLDKIVRKSYACKNRLEIVRIKKL